MSFDGTRAIGNDGFEVYDPTQWGTVNPDAVRADGRRIAKTVNEREGVKGYIAEDFKYATSSKAKAQKKYLEDSSLIYGDQMHRVRGDGNCGTTAFATGLLYHILNSPQEQSQAIIETTTRLMTSLDASKSPQLESDIIETMGLIVEFGNNLNDQFLQQALLMNDRFMSSFSRVIRAIGHQGIKDLLGPEIGGSEEDIEDFAEDIIPNAPREEIRVDGYNSLSQLFNLRTHVIDVTGQVSTNVINQYPKSDNVVADVVIIHAPNHFFTIIPDKQRQENHGLQSAAAAVQNAKPQYFTLQRREVRPVHRNSCLTIAKLAIPAITVVGLWIAGSYIYSLLGGK